MWDLRIKKFVDLVTFTEEILSTKLNFCAATHLNI